ncbi:MULTISPECIES: halomucin [Bacillus]|uniref:halomucin n=1 Tax=Bacillus TaxID=1386 RepID=UPI0009D8B9F8|nr:MULTISPECIES: halomucin [Bacillus]NRQ68403.1 halomucin [Bacillus cereus]PEC00016.1 halomucin [Bacillus cereus]PEC29516.1 halomucin [Bacillus thuringiensis]PEQ76226.1 halomucin [Bacillus cereus]PFZ24523.1 halomucin [Bacillus thuringiensis]
MDHSVKLTREQLLNTLYGTSYNMDGSVVKDTETIRNYTIEVIDKKVHLKTFNIPVQILVENEWCDIESVVSDEDLSLIYSTFQEVHLDSEIILDTDDPTGISVRSRERVRDLSNLISEAGIDLPREFTWVDGASETSGVIILPQDDYDKVFIATDPDKDGNPLIVFIEQKTEKNQERPYFVKERGKTYIYVDHFSGGGGTQSSPYLVEDEKDLHNVRSNLGAYYTQTKDIIMTSYQTGSGFTPIDNFKGYYDGAGYDIKDLYIKNTTSNVGLFGTQLSGTIKRVRLINVNIVANGSIVGALIGKSDGDIEDCAVISGTVKNDGSSAGHTGGLVGYQNAGKILRSYSHADVMSTGNNCGGFVGSVTGGSVFECFSTGSVTDLTVAKNASNHGGFVGYVGSGSVSNCYYNLTKQSGIAKGDGTALNESEMKKASSYPFDYQNFWYIGDYKVNKGYPENRKFIKYKKGKGTSTDPFLIYNQFDLEQVRHFANKHFRMENDIVLDYPKTGPGWLPIGRGMSNYNNGWWANIFEGTFDGNNKAIGNLYMYRRSHTNAGLFEQLSNYAIVKNFTIIDVDIEVGNKSGIVVGKMEGNSQLINVSVRMFNSFNYKAFASLSDGSGSGGLVGVMDEETIIENCHFDAPIQQQSGHFGGIVGCTGQKAVISKCTVSGIFDQVNGDMGGIIGNIPYIGFPSRLAQNIKVQDCVVHADMRQASYSSGVVGGVHFRKGDYYNVNRNSSYGVWGVTLSKVIITGHAKASALSNWILDSNYGGQTPDASYFISEWTIDNSFYNRDRVSGGTYNALTAKYTPEIRHPSTYGAYNFVNIWAFDEKNRDGDPVLIKHIPPKLPILGFRNEIGLYYTDEAGNILRYLEYGTLVAGSTSEAYPVWLQNNADFPVKDMKVWVDPPTVKPGITVQLSLSNNPFVPVDEIPFPGTIPIGDARQFYIRFLSEVTVTEGGTFDMKAKASPA